MPENVSELVQFVRDSCPKLEFIGLMTIGAYEHSYGPGENPDFISLINCRQKVSEKLSIPIEEMELSMGMSADFEHAVSFKL